MLVVGMMSVAHKKELYIYDNTDLCGLIASVRNKAHFLTKRTKGNTFHGWGGSAKLPLLFAAIWLKPLAKLDELQCRNAVSAPEGNRV